MYRTLKIAVLAVAGTAALACSSDPEGGSDGAGGSTAASGASSGGTGAADGGSGGTSAGSGGVTGGGGGATGGAAGSGGGAGADTGGSGGSSSGSGGLTSGAGGSEAGAGGTMAGAGGTMAGAGGTMAGAGGTSGGSGGSSGSAGGGAFVLPPPNAQFDYQIGGGYTPPDGVQVVSRDREDSPAAGLYNICYVNGFQIQPGEESWWETNHPDLILRDADGDPVIDAGWDEMLVDTSTEAKREAAAAVIGAWIEQCAADGFDAVEIDNLDSYSRSDGLLTQSDNVAFMGMLADIAHANGLAAAQKNSTELLDEVPNMHTDFAIAEECNRWNECGDYQSVYGNLVFVIEYRQQDFEAGCTNFPELSIVLRNVAVSTPSSGNYVYDAC